MGLLALALWQSHDLCIQQAIDMQCASPSRMRTLPATVQFAIGDTTRNIMRVFNDYISHVSNDPSASQTTTPLAQLASMEELLANVPPVDTVKCHVSDDLSASQTTTPLAQRAWIAHHISQLASMEERLADVPPVNTVKLSDKILRFLAKASQDSFQLDEKKPKEVTRTVAVAFNKGRKQVDAKVNRYQHKIRGGKNQQACIHVPGATTGGGYSIPANVTVARGEGVRLKVEGNISGSRVALITLTGREDPTAAEVKRAQVVLMILQGKMGAVGSEGLNPWVHQIYLDPGEEFAWPAEWAKDTIPPIKFKLEKIPRPLNSSQVKVIKRMCSQADEHRVSIIQGPPGTGKTTVIASYVLTAVGAGQTGIWLIAQSNIAVKNIAEKLADFGLTNWKLLVSSEFYEYWHEHLYAHIHSNIIISEEFIEKSTMKQLYGCPVVLCTLSMLSSNKLHQLGAFKMVPLRNIVVDEASQIEIGDYIPVFTTASTIRKVTFIGDDKQLPPHGQEEIGELQSIFEVEHLRKHMLLLDTQYCMPPQIGEFIFQTVYEGHPLCETSNITCYFINVTGLQVSVETSWKNPEECKAIFQLSFIFQGQGKGFKIITPYDAQRTLIENSLKEAELQWEDTCFNVDSFQGLYHHLSCSFLGVGISSRW
ncbi:P-loop containing nucleoside triphosphate hydrolase protein [Scleroderma citrinum]